MSQYQPLAGSQAHGEAMTELLDELSFQKALLNSLDDSVENQEEAEDEVRKEIKAIEKKIRDLRRGTTSTASDFAGPSASQDSQTLSSQPSSNNRRNNTAMFETPGRSSSAYQVGEQWQSLDSAPSTASTPASSNSMTEFPTPSKVNLPSRKRSHSKHIDGLAPFTDNKSRRTSPSPYMTGVTTPSSSGEDFDDEFLIQQKSLEDRIRREKLDEEYARSLQHPKQSMNPPSVPSGLSAFDRMSGRRPTPVSSIKPEPGRSSSHRKLPWATSQSSTNVKSEPRSMGSSIKNEASSSSYMSYNPYSSSSFNMPLKLKEERPKMPGTYEDESSSAGDSDIEIIDATDFNGNGRHVQTSARPNWPSQSVRPSSQSIPRPDFSSATQTAGQADAFRQGEQERALNMALYGKSTPRSWATTSSSSLPGQPSQNFSNTTMNFPNPLGSSSQYGMASGMHSMSSAGANGYNNVYNSTSMGSGMQGGYSGYADYSGYSGTQIAGPDMGFTFNNNPFSSASQVIDLTNADDFTSMIRSNNFDQMADMFNQPVSEAFAGQLDYIVNDPRKTNEEIKALIENIRPDEELPVEDREGTPEGLKYPLYEHQKLALTWLKSMEEGTNKGGILADDMGLGKTISSLALILSRPSTDPARKTTLIVGPVALVRQWEREIRKKIKGGPHKLSTHMVHGQGRKLSWDELRNYEVVLTTYGTLAAEYKRWEKHLEKEHEAGRFLEREQETGQLKKLFPLLGPSSKFYRVILDEAQCIKNKTTLSARAACRLAALTRFCLTGTPMMNNVGELYSLIHFLRIKPYNDYQRFQHDFGKLTKGDTSDAVLQKQMLKLQAVLKAVLLRRTKTSLIDGKPIITLPPKTELIDHVVFDEDEKNFYNALESKTRIQFNKYMRAGTVGKNYSNILVLLLRLRQCCCHPHLITDFDEAPSAATASLTKEAMIMLAESLQPEVIERLLAADGFECPVCYDGVENPSIIIPCGHDTCAECLAKITDQATQENVAQGNETGGAARCPSCRGKLEPNKIIDYTTFKKVHMKNAEAVVDDEETASEASDSDDSEDLDSETESEDDANGNGDLRGFVVYDDETTEDEEDPIEDDDDEAEAPRAKSKGKEKVSANEEDGDDEEDAPKAKSKARNKEEKRRRRAKKGKRKEKDSTKQHLSIAMLKKEANRSIEGRRRYMRYLRKNWQPSAKVNKCVELLEQFLSDGQKTIIFSQFVSLLDLLQVPIDQKGWDCERYDGSMKADDRNDAINRFTDNRDTKIMLISLKAGNAGLNLVAASRVIILDPFWNPFIEMQAVDRAYRIGQQRSVEVHRILIRETVEDRIMELQEKKKKMVNEALSDSAGKSISRLGERELAFLFGVGRE